MLEQDEKGRLTPFVRVLVENALAENADFGRITPTIEELVKKTIKDGRASAQREIKEALEEVNSARLSPFVSELVAETIELIREEKRNTQEIIKKEENIINGNINHQKESVCHLNTYLFDKRLYKRSLESENLEINSQNIQSRISESSKSSSQDMSRSSESENASRVASRMAKETIQVEISKEIVEKAVEDGLASASGMVIFYF
ncbi:unnamed protein product [Oikopleura dioica]|uniref:Uncharacterized protein n=1 Tax=Oikopleura dioica TaxID=34765 RepID=E4YBZ2_OIKDI|nr:unnamed protein product [Oikopleura dioica]